MSNQSVGDISRQTSGGFSSSGNRETNSVSWGSRLVSVVSEQRKYGGLGFLDTCVKIGKLIGLIKIVATSSQEPGRWRVWAWNVGEVESEQSEGVVVESEQPKGVVVESEQPKGVVVKSEQPKGVVVSGGKTEQSHPGWIQPFLLNVWGAEVWTERRLRGDMVLWQAKAASSTVNVNRKIITFDQEHYFDVRAPDLRFFFEGDDILCKKVTSKGCADGILRRYEGEVRFEVKGS